MDNVTHSLTGLVLARTGLDRLTARASWTLLLAANAPDSDIVTLAKGSLVYFHYHRGPTHSLVGAPVMAALVTLVMWIFRPRKEPVGTSGFHLGWTYVLALIGVGSHLLMDFTNSYGIRLFLPFSTRMPSWDIVPLIDPWILAALALALALPALNRLVSGEIGANAKAQPGRGRAAAILALLFILGWWGFRDGMHRRALAMLEANTYGSNPAAGELAPGVAPGRVAAFATGANPWLWRGLVETETFYEILDMDVRATLDPARGRLLYKSPDTAAVAAAKQSKCGVAFVSFAHYLYASVVPAEEGSTVTIVDLRFPFQCRVELDSSLRITAESFHY